jgi:hypothetical protein
VPRSSMPRLRAARRSAVAMRVLVSLAACPGVGRWPVPCGLGVWPGWWRTFRRRCPGTPGSTRAGSTAVRCSHYCAARLSPGERAPKPQWLGPIRCRRAACGAGGHQHAGYWPASSHRPGRTSRRRWEGANETSGRRRVANGQGGARRRNATRKRAAALQRQRTNAEMPRLDEPGHGH